MIKTYVCCITVDSSALMLLELSRSFIDAHLAAGRAGRGAALSVVLESVRQSRRPRSVFRVLHYTPDTRTSAVSVLMRPAVHGVHPGRTFAFCSHACGLAPPDSRDLLT